MYLNEDVLGEVNWLAWKLVPVRVAGWPCIVIFVA